METGEKISVELFGLLFLEPMTAITDLILFLICLFFAYELHKNKASKVIVNWKKFFLFMGISTFLGSIAHGLFHYLDGRPFLAVFLSMQVAAGYAIYFAESASINFFASAKNKVILKKVIVLKLFIMIVAVLYFHDFRVVVINTAIGFLTIIWFKIREYFNGNLGSGFIAIGIVMAVFTAFIHGNKFSLHAWMNYNDISHFMLMIGFYLIFIGVRKTKLKLEGEGQK